jgi:hypothetical protein
MTKKMYHIMLFIAVLTLFSMWLIEGPETNNKGNNINVMPLKESASLNTSHVQSQSSSHKLVDSNQTLLMHINAIMEVNLDLSPTVNEYDSCQQITRTVSEANLSEKLVQSILMKCRT